MEKKERDELMRKAAKENNYPLFQALYAYEQSGEIRSLVHAIESLTEMHQETTKELVEARQVSKIPALPKHLYDNLHTTRAGEMTDGSHSFDELYHHRMILFATIVKGHRDKAWKSWKHEDGTMFEDYFIVGITTSEGDFSYHYHKDHWNLFEAEILDKAPKFDGHTAKDVGRLIGLW